MPSQPSYPLLSRRDTLKAAGAATLVGSSRLINGDPRADTTVSEASETRTDTLYEETVDSVVTVRVFDRQGGQPQGSGWVYEVDGAGVYVVTNWHVITNAFGVDVRFSGGEWRQVTELAGVDPYSDLAVLRVPDVPEYVEALSIADLPVPGTAVAAFGSPLGLAGSVTTGIVSALGRATTVGYGGSVYTVTDTIQTDTAITPGNSGGPLVNEAGRVVGINFAGVHFFAGQNINFAISSVMAVRAIPEIIDTGTFSHPYVGIRTTTLSPTIARLNEIDPTTVGVYVDSTIAGYPASDMLSGATASDRVTGISIGGDVILEVDGTVVTDTDALQRHLFTEFNPGDTVSFMTLRDGTHQEVELTLVEKPLPFERRGVLGPSM